MRFLSAQLLHLLASYAQRHHRFRKALHTLGPLAPLAVVAALVLTGACSSVPTSGVKKSEPQALESPAFNQSTALVWRTWEPAAFAQAREENRLLLVFVGTEWCHWCHVMDDKTWADARLQALLEEHFVIIRVDADDRPDVAERYEEWAWPATAVLTPQAQPVLEMKGYRSATKVLDLLATVVADHVAGRKIGRPTIAEPSPNPAAADLAQVRNLVVAQLDRYWDDEMAGWGRPKKYPILAPIEHAFYRAERLGEDIWFARALTTLRQQQRITDPIWGGMYQYSTRSNWDHPHYEKLAFMQGWALRMYAEGFVATKNKAWLETAQATARYVTTILSSKAGTFYATQDADVGTRGDAPFMLGKEFYALDDEGRRAAGMPYIDQHIFAEHNGYIIAGLASLAAVSGDADVLAAALKAANEIVRTHRVKHAFLHTAVDESGRFYLADQVAMAEAMLALYEATADLRWRQEALSTMQFVRSALRDPLRGTFFANTRTGDEVGVFAQHRRPFALGVRANRLLFRLSLYSDLDGTEDFAAEAALGLKGFARRGHLKQQGRMVGDYALALEDALHEPVHIAVVAAEGQDLRALYHAALLVHAPGRILERLHPGGRFPDLGRPAAFICGSAFCSRPIFEPEKVASTAAGFIRVAESEAIAEPEAVAEPATSTAAGASEQE